MNNPKWRQIGRGTVLCTALAFCLALQACAPAEVRDDLPVVGPFAEAVGDDRYAFEPLDIDQPYNLEVINLHGGIRIRKAPADEAFARVSYPDSHKPGATMMTIKDGRHRLWLLDTLDAKNDDFPECPVQQHDNTVKRLGQKLPRVELELWLPAGSVITIRACTNLWVNADAKITAHCGNDIEIEGGSGWLNARARSVKAGLCTYAVRAAVTNSASFSNTIGDKFIRGDGNVTIRGGQGFLNIDVGGKVWADTSISEGYERSDRATTTSTSGGAVAPIGPSAPFDWPARREWERHHIFNQVIAPTIEILLPIDQQLAVDVDVRNGVLHSLLPHDETVVSRRVLDERIRVQEASESSLQFTLNNPVGELRIRAESRADVLVLKTPLVTPEAGE